MLRKQTIVEEFDPRRVRPLPGQPRKRFRGIAELAASISEIGQSCPGIVTLVGDDPDYDAQLVDGERRLRACTKAGVNFRAEVRPAADEEAIFVASFGANFGKQDHDVMEIAEALERMHRAGKTIEQLGRIAGKSLTWVAQHLNLLKLHPDVRAMMVPGAGEDEGEGATPTLTFAVAQLLVPVAENEQLSLAKKITKGDGMSLVAARRLVLRERSESGDADAYANSHGPRRSVLTIESILEEMSDRIGVYLDMPGADINRLIDAAAHLEKRQLIKSIEEVGEDLAALADAIRRRLPTIGQRVAVTA